MADLGYRLTYSGEETQEILDSVKFKEDKVEGKGLSENDFTNEDKSKLDGIESGAQKNVNADWEADSGDALILNRPDLSQFITRTVDNLVNYYTRSDTYTRVEVQSIVNAIKQFTYVSVSTLPTASASTMNRIYLVPSADPKMQNVKDEYITIEGSGVYDWEQIGSTAISLDGYVTTEDLNTALASYVTSSAFNTALAAKQDVISDLATIRSGAAAGATAYQKPSTGIPETDLAQAVQTSLGKADTALQSHQDISGKQDKINVSGILKGTGNGNVSAAEAGTDYQAPLVSGENIKTINNNSLLGAGNISIVGEQGAQGVGISSITQTTTSTESGGVNQVRIAWTNGQTTILSIRNGAKGETGGVGPQGNSGYSGDISEIEVVNNLTDGGETAVLSAEQGKILKALIDSLGGNLSGLFSSIEDGEKMSVNTVTLRGLQVITSGDIYDSMSLFGVKNLMGVTAIYSDGSTETVTDFLLSGVIQAGTQTFTVTYQGVKSSIAVTVLHREATLTGITAACSEAETSMYIELEQLRPYMSVHKVYSDDTTELTDDYTFSGELDAGESTITVTYTPDSSLTATFTITGVSDGSHTTDGLTAMVDFSQYEDGYTGDIINTVNGNVVSTGTGTLEQCATKAPYGGIHNHTYVMAKWAQGTSVSALRLSLPESIPAFPLTLELYARIRAPYNNGGTTPVVGAFSSSMQSFFTFRAGTTSYFYNVSTNANQEIKVQGPAATPAVTTSGANLPVYDSNNPNVKDLSHIVICLGTKIVKVYVNNTKIYDGTNSTYSNAGGGEIDLFKDPRYIAGDICMFRMYDKILNDREIQRNYLNCTTKFGTVISEE